MGPRGNKWPNLLASHILVKLLSCELTSWGGLSYFPRDS
jgi:hypothetical protein